MATNAAQLGQLSSLGGQYQPYPYSSAPYTDQYASASLPQGQVQNFIQSPPPGGRAVNQPRFGERTVARSGGGRRKQRPARGPIVSREDASPVVPLYSYPSVKNGTVVQLPIFWTALSIALGYEVQGDQVVRGLPCIKRLYQLFCRNAGSQYPMDRIESFIMENKALTRRMFGEFQPLADPLDEVHFPDIQAFETVDFPESLRPMAVADSTSAPPELTEPAAPTELTEPPAAAQVTERAGDVGAEAVVEPPPSLQTTESSLQAGAAEPGSEAVGGGDPMPAGDVGGTAGSDTLGGANKTGGKREGQKAYSTSLMDMLENQELADGLLGSAYDTVDATGIAASGAESTKNDSRMALEFVDGATGPPVGNGIALSVSGGGGEPSVASSGGSAESAAPGSSQRRARPSVTVVTDSNTPAGTGRSSPRLAPSRRRPLRSSLPVRPRPPANQDSTQPARPISGEDASGPPMSAAGRARGPGCGIAVPSIGAREKYEYSEPAAPLALQKSDEQRLPRVRRSPHSSNDTVTTPKPGRRRRQAVSAPPIIDKGSKDLVDSCESKVEIITPYWAANSAGEIRAIVNTKHFPQAIHQEICKGTTTSRCTGNCLCEQKYTYHRLLSYDPDNDCKGIFIDWFLFPSCCACRCPP